MSEDKVFKLTRAKLISGDGEIKLVSGPVPSEGFKLDNNVEGVTLETLKIAAYCDDLE